MRIGIVAFVLLPVMASAAFAQCSDFYSLFMANFSDFSAPKYVAFPGDEISFSFAIAASQKQINDGTVRVQILYRPENSASDYGDAVVDDFYLADKVNLKKGTARKMNFAWLVPKSAASGDYSAVLYLYEGPFQTGGAAFSPDMFSSSLGFSVLGNKDRAYFDRSKILVSGRQYNPVNTLDIVREQGDVIYVEVPIKNEGPEREAYVSYALYVSDELKQEQLSRIRGELSGPLLEAFSSSSKGGEEHIILPANGERLFWADFGKLPPGIYIAKFTLIFEDSEEFLYVTIPIRGEKADFAYAGLSAFPIKAGEQASIELCFQLTTETSNQPIPAKIFLELDDDQNKILEGTFEVNVTSTPSSLRVPFSPSSDFRSGTMKASIVSATGLLDYIIVPFNYSEYYNAKELSLSSSLWERGVFYESKFRDDLGYPEKANATLYILGSDGSVVEQKNIQFTGEASGYAELQPGQYELRITEGKSWLSRTSSITVPAKPVPSRGQDPSIILAAAILAITAIIAWRLRRK